MKELKKVNDNNVRERMARTPYEEITKRKNARGITLIALIITIVVMAIMVVVSIQIALETGLFETAGKATKNWEEAQQTESELGDGKVTIGGITYNSIEEYTSIIGTGDNEETGADEKVDFEILFQTAVKHPEQSATNNDIGIAEDGSIVNLDLWPYTILGDGESYVLNDDISQYGDEGYPNSNIVDGKIIGKVPMYIKEEGKEFYPVTDMTGTFKGCTSLITAPELPSTVVRMRYIFCECTSLISAPKLPDIVKDIECSFMGCTSLTTAPEIPSSVENMQMLFMSCTSLTGTLTINTNTSYDGGFLTEAATAEGCNLVLKGTSTRLNEILSLYDYNPNITIGT